MIEIRVIDEFCLCDLDQVWKGFSAKDFLVSRIAQRW